MASRKDSGDVVSGADKGFVMGIDYIGEYDPDVDGNKWGFVSVEVGHTDYGVVGLSKDKEALTTLNLIKNSQNEIQDLSKDDMVLKRIHHDKDKSFESVVKTYMRDERIVY